MSFELDAKTNVIDKLTRLPTIEAFWNTIDQVSKKLQNPGSVSSVRELELELLCSAKV
jgi:hypothetical protein